ncbi:hypothetical protein CAEBREN_24676, partial [Caenorhabditis brenneri]
MSRVLYLLALAAFGVVLCHVSPPMINGRPREGLIAGDPDPEGPRSEDKYMVYSEIVQYVDHFSNGTNTGTWRQRYQYNSKFYNKTVGYVFLMLGGEGSINGTNGDKWVRHEAETMMTWAAEFGAAAFQVEHRFYGSKDYSPIGDQTPFQVAKHNLGSPFGGFFILDSFFGLVLEKTNIPKRTPRKQFSSSINWSHQNPSQTTIQVRDLPVSILKISIFSLCDDFDENNLSKSLQFFFQNVYGYFQGINQYTGDNRNNATRSGLGVPAAC